MGFPRTFDEITPEWLTSVLRESGERSDAKVIVKSCEVKGIGSDQGLTSDVGRLDLRFDGEGEDAHRTMIAKMIDPDRLVNVGVSGRTAFEREVRFFNELAPKSGMRTPTVYFADFDTTNDNFLLLIEDLGGLRSVEQADGCDSREAESVLRSLAIMHAKWWNDSSLHGYSWLSDRPNMGTTEDHMEQLPANIDRFLERADIPVPDGVEAVARKLAPRFLKVSDAVVADPVTLTHGDFKLANIFFDDSNEDEEVIVAVDWQMAGRIQAANDVATFIMLGMTTETRRQHETNLVSGYHSALVDRGVRDYSYDEMLLDIRMAMLPRLASLIRIVSNLNNNPATTTADKALWMSMIGNFQTVIDWNCDEVIPK